MNTRRIYIRQDTPADLIGLVLHARKAFTQSLGVMPNSQKKSHQ